MSSEEETQLLSDAELHSAPSGRAHCTLRGCSAKKEHRDIRQHYRQSHSMYAPVQFPEEGTQHVFRSKHGYFRCPRCESIYYSTATLQKHTRTCDAPPPQLEQMPPQPVSIVPVETPPPADVSVQRPTPGKLDRSPPAQPPQVEQGPSQPASVISVDPSPSVEVSTQRPTPERSDTFPPAQPPIHTHASPVLKQDVPKELSKHDFPNQLRHILHQTSSSHSRAEHRFKPYPSSNTPGGERQKSRSNHSVPYPLAFHPSSLVRHHTPVSLQHQHLQHHEPSLSSKRPDANPIKSENTTYHPPEFRLPPYMTPPPFNQPTHSESSSDKDKEKSPTPIISDPKLTEDPMEGMQLMYPSSDEELEETQSPRVPSPEPARIPTRGYKPSLSPVSPVSPLTPVSPVSPFMPKMPAVSGNVPTQGPLTPPPECTTFVPFNRRRPPPPIMSNLRHQLPSPVPSPLNSVHLVPPRPPCMQHTLRIPSLDTYPVSLGIAHAYHAKMVHSIFTVSTRIPPTVRATFDPIWNYEHERYRYPLYLASRPTMACLTKLAFATISGSNRDDPMDVSSANDAHPSKPTGWIRINDQSESVHSSTTTARRLVPPGV
ncbi:hypothetical protein QCA50_002282 [Cerrena zonata]|uniref:C2H2-type domain-containing protein n=1 Tax=Cerrena zonata TaxID=2478898 RepID=A0AAW0GR37_9APHY